MNLQCQLVVAAPPAGQTRRISVRALSFPPASPSLRSRTPKSLTRAVTRARSSVVLASKDNSLSTTTSRVSTNSGSTGLSETTGVSSSRSAVADGPRPTLSSSIAPRRTSSSSSGGSGNEAERLLRPLSRSVSERSACSVETTASSISPSVFGALSGGGQSDAGSQRSTASTGATSLSSPASTTTTAGASFGLSSFSGGGGGGGASGSSSSTTATTTKRVVPLYNLQFHTVRQTTVTDAGTDAKVGVFQKRALDLQGLGSLECCEMAGPYTPAQASSASASASVSVSTAVTAAAAGEEGLIGANGLAGRGLTVAGDGSGGSGSGGGSGEGPTTTDLSSSLSPVTASSPAAGRRLAVPLDLPSSSSGTGSPRLSLDTLFTRPSFDDVRFGLGGAATGLVKGANAGPRRGLGQVAATNPAASGRPRSTRSTQGSLGGGSGGVGGDRGGSPASAGNGGGGVGKKMVEETAQAGRKLFGRLFGNGAVGSGGGSGGGRRRDGLDDDNHVEQGVGAGSTQPQQQQQQRGLPGGFFRSSPAMMASLFSSSSSSAGVSHGAGRTDADGGPAQTAAASSSADFGLGAIANDGRPSSLAPPAGGSGAGADSRRASTSSRRSSTDASLGAGVEGAASSPAGGQQQQPRPSKRSGVVGAFIGGGGRPKSSAFSIHSATSAIGLVSADPVPSGAGSTPAPPPPAATMAAGGQQAAPYLGAPTLGLAPVVRPPTDGGSTTRKTSAYVCVDLLLPPTSCPSAPPPPPGHA